jgi:metal-dependent amidase/aminoacylase/carboxypeptidase family protein
MADAFTQNASLLGREFASPKTMPPGFAGSTDMGNVSHRVPSIHPMMAVAPMGVIIHNAEFARWAASDKGDSAAIDGAKALAMTALDLMYDKTLLDTVQADFDATADVSKAALAKLNEKVTDSHAGHGHAQGHGHAAAGCGCA